MRQSRHSTSLGGHGLLVNMALLALLTLFMVICVTGIIAGLDGVRKAQPMDFMAPAWFVASAVGAVTIALIMIAFLIDIVRNMLSGNLWARRRRR